MSYLHDVTSWNDGMYDVIWHVHWAYNKPRARTKGGFAGPVSEG